ncbi:MAG: SIS domain-containing protein [Ruminococcus sp.]
MEAIDLSPKWDLLKKSCRLIARIYIVACGSAYHVGMVGQYVTGESGADIPVEVGSGIRVSLPQSKACEDPTGLVIVICQSGETADSLAALRLAKEARGRNPWYREREWSSSIARESRLCILYPMQARRSRLPRQRPTVPS